jgi:HK97 family phage prohead protease
MDIAGGCGLTLASVRSMANFFDRHSADAGDAGFLAGDPGFPSPARVAWSLHGGDTAFAWADKVIRTSGASRKRGRLRERSLSMDGEVERRFIGPFDNVESPDFDMLTVEERADEPGGRPKTYLVGYAAVFGQDSVLLGDFIERIEPSAFEIVKSGKDKRGKPLATRGLFNHDPNHLLGRYPVTMRMWVDEKGLKYEILLPESRRDIAESVRRGDLRGSSFSFVVAPGGEKWHYENGQSIRTVTAIKSLVDCGPVTYPAYEASSVAVAQRSLQMFKSQNTVDSRRAAVRASIMGEVQKCRELLESRDCGRGEGGKFGSGNTCQAGGDAVDKKASDKNIATKALGQYNSGTSKDESGMDTPGGTGGAAVGAFTWGTIGAGFGAIAGLPGIAAGLIIGTVAGGLAGRIASEKAAKTYDSLKKSAGVSDDQIVKASKAMSPTGGSKGTVFVTDDMGGIGITGEKNSEIAVLTSGNKGTALSYYNDKKSVEPSIGRAISVAKTLNADMVSLTANNGNDAKALEKAGFEKVSDKAYVKTLGKKSKRSDSPIAETYDDLVNFLAERRAADCGRGGDGKFNSGNKCAGGDGGGGGDEDEPPSKASGSKAEGSTPASGDSKYMEWKKGDHKVPGKTEKAQSFMDKARKDQTISAGKDGGKSDDGGGVQTWSKGDSYPWTVKQVGDVDGHMQGIHPDGSKTEKYKFYGGDTKEASKKLAEEIAKRKKAK